VGLAAARGARVLATGEPGDEDRLRRLGAGELIDYSQADLVGAIRERHPAGVQGLIDVVNFAEAFGAATELLAEGGRAASTLGAADVDQLAAQGFSATNVLAVPEPELLARLAKQADTDDLTVSIDKVYSLLEAPKALDDFRDGKRGKIALSVSD
jgi:NADPH2:quinone reductase